ncbi:MAG: CRISPR-associated endonuclease Cas1 [Zestosphaera sp.]
MKNLIIGGYGISLRIKKGNIVLTSKKKTQAVPLTDIDSIIILTSGVTISSKAIRALANSGVQLVVTDSRGMPTSVLHHPFTTRTVETRRAQCEAIHNKKANHLIKVIASSKTGNQAAVLRRLVKSTKKQELLEDVKKIEKISHEVMRLREDDLSTLRKKVMELEAEAARLYWSAVSSITPEELGFRGRNQDGCDQVNASLNYGYGILYPVIWRSTVIFGMDPYAGFLHVDRSGKPVLTYDLIEVFRAVGTDLPLVKSFLTGLRVEVKECLLSPESRSRIAQIVLKNLKERYSAWDEVRDLESWVKRLTYLISSYLRGRTELKPLVFR